MFKVNYNDTENLNEISEVSQMLNRVVKFLGNDCIHITFELFYGTIVRRPVKY